MKFSTALLIGLLSIVECLAGKAKLFVYLIFAEKGVRWYTGTQKFNKEAGKPFAFLKLSYMDFLFETILFHGLVNGQKRRLPNL